MASTSIARQRLSQIDVGLVVVGGSADEDFALGPSYRAWASSVLSAVDIAFELGRRCVAIIRVQEPEPETVDLSLCVSR